MGIVINKAKIAFSPEQVGYVAEKINEVDNHLIKLIEEKRLISAGYIISKDNKIFAHCSMGKLRYDSEDGSFRPDSIRRIASMSKMFTAVAVMQLVEQGKIYLKQPIRTLIREFDKKIFRDITIFDLLTHTSGLCPTPGCLNEPYPLDISIFERDGWIKEALRGNVYSERGKQWAYSSFGFMVLAEIVQRISGVDYEEYIIKNIFEPLGLKNTFFQVPDELINRVCVSDKHSEKTLKLDSTTKMGAPRGNSGIYSTLEDMRIFGQMLLNRGIYNGVRILSRKTVEIMTQNQLENVHSYCFNDNGMKIDYGLGVAIYSNDELVSPGSFGHEGAGLSGMVIDPIENLVFVYFCPLPVPVWIPEAVVNLRNIVWSGII